MDHLELAISRKNLLKRLQELDRFKHSGSVKDGEIEQLQQKGRVLEGDWLDNLLKWNEEGVKPRSSSCTKKKKKRNVKEVKRVVTDLDSVRTLIKTQNETLDECEERFRKYNIPKRFDQNRRKQPLRPHVERLHEFMETTWRREAKKNREKGYSSLIELMRKIDITDDEDGLIAFTSLENCFSQLGTKISSFFIDYIFLLIVASNASIEVASLSLYELKSVLECLYLGEELSSSLVTGHVVLMVEFFIEALELAGPLWDNEKSLNESENQMYCLGDEIEDYVVHHIIMEVLRLEVSFCSPDFPMMLVNDVFYSISKHLEENVFKDKLEKVADVTNVCQIAVKIEHQQFSSEMKFLRQVLEAGVHELWTERDPELRTLVRLMMI